MPIKSSALESFLLGTGLIEDQRFMAQVSHYYNQRNPKRLYSYEDYNGLLNSVLAYRYPSLPREQAMVELGTEAIKGYARTIAGQIGLAGVGVVSPGRVMQVGAQLTHEMCPDSQIELQQISDSDFRMSYRNCPLPPYLSMGVANGFWEDRAEVSLEILPETAPLIYNYNVIYKLKLPD